MVTDAGCHHAGRRAQRRGRRGGRPADHHAAGLPRRARRRRHAAGRGLNTQHRAGFDRNGDAGGDLFALDPADPAGTLRVAFDDPALLAASGVPGGGLDGSNADALTVASTAAETYQRLVNGLGTEVASTQRLASNQRSLTAQVDGSREQLSGVNLDEEMVTMLQAQRAYEAAARLMTTVDAVLDTLINRTGLVR